MQAMRCGFSGSGNQESPPCATVNAASWVSVMRCGQYVNARAHRLRAGAFFMMGTFLC